MVQILSFIKIIFIYNTTICNDKENETSKNFLIRTCSGNPSYGKDKCDLQCMHTCIKQAIALFSVPSLYPLPVMPVLGPCKSQFSFASWLPVRLCQLGDAGGRLEGWRRKKGLTSSCLLPVPFNDIPVIIFHPSSHSFFRY